MLPEEQLPPPPRTKSRSNGCGALLHSAVSIMPRTRFWYGWQEGMASTVVPLDTSYFPSELAESLNLKDGGSSPCGCGSTGVGCAVCGNALGKRQRYCITHGPSFAARHDYYVFFPTAVSSAHASVTESLSAADVSSAPFPPHFPRIRQYSPAAPFDIPFVPASPHDTIQSFSTEPSHPPSSQDTLAALAPMDNEHSEDADIVTLAFDLLSTRRANHTSSAAHSPVIPTSHPSAVVAAPPNALADLVASTRAAIAAECAHLDALHGRLDALSTSTQLAPSTPALLRDITREETGLLARVRGLIANIRILEDGGGESTAALLARGRAMLERAVSTAATPGDAAEEDKPSPPIFER
ncbi:hypothetical protein B0H11DRAFT_2045228 [Mycena galericulata]|nr:hypothetical protein B0H11DRAFT_2109744 [Mycena galericulata]KAJ7468890.1 hypothetical protein B0H11DRAFT_2045228 [Mycena galericulata]